MFESNLFEDKNLVTLKKNSCRLIQFSFSKTSPSFFFRVKKSPFLFYIIEEEGSDSFTYSFFLLYLFNVNDLMCIPLPP